MVNNHYIIITNNKHKWSNINQSIIFSTLDDNHVLQLIFLQKFKIHSCRSSILYIILDDLDLDDFNLHPKLYNILKYSAENTYNIHIVSLDDTSTDSFSSILNNLYTFFQYFIITNVKYINK